MFAKQSGFGLDKSFFKNKPLIGALILSMGLQLSAVYLPFMNELLGTSPLQAGTWGIIFLAASLSTLVVMGLKSLSVEVKTARKPTSSLVFLLFAFCLSQEIIYKSKKKVIIDESTIDESIIREEYSMQLREISRLLYQLKIANQELTATFEKAPDSV